MFTLPPLPYDFDALEPHIDSKTMEIHHGKHHQTYVDKLNAAIKGTEFEEMEVQELLKNIQDVSADKKQAVINHGGGHANHTLFWQILSPEGGGEPSGALLQAIEEKFGSFDKFKELFSTAAIGVFGSGWAWLIITKDGELEIITTPNQNSPLMSQQIPLLGLDVWEHAYYLKYQNKRPDYISAFWNIINWAKVEELFEEATQ